MDERKLPGSDPKPENASGPADPGFGLIEAWALIQALA